MNVTFGNSFEGMGYSAHDFGRVQRSAQNGAQGMDEEEARLRPIGSDRTERPNQPQQLGRPDGADVETNSDPGRAGRFDQSQARETREQDQTRGRPTTIPGRAKRTEGANGTNGTNSTNEANGTPDAAGSGKAGGGDSMELSPEAKKMVAELKARDQQVRAHEAAHLAAGAGIAKGGAQFTTQRGPDGNMYAIGGEVPIDAGAVPGDPRATLAKAQQISAAALAPADPSPQDRAVAAQARQMAAQASAEMMRDPDAATGTGKPETTNGTADTTNDTDTANAADTTPVPIGTNAPETPGAPDTKNAAERLNEIAGRNRRQAEAADAERGRVGQAFQNDQRIQGAADRRVAQTRDDERVARTMTAQGRQAVEAYAAIEKIATRANPAMAAFQAVA